MIRSAFLVLALSLAALPVPADGGLDQLLREVRQELSRTRDDSRERVERFKSRRDQQQVLLAEARAGLEAQRQRRAELEQRHAANAEQLVQRKGDLEERLGELRELFGLVRQNARDNAETLAASLGAARLGGEVARLRELGESRELPDLARLEGLWLDLLATISASARVERFQAPVIVPQGSESERDVTRIGFFTAVSGGRFLRWLPDSGRFVELARQPPPRLRAQALQLEQATSGIVQAPVDPSRGALMAVLVQTPSLRERIDQGGIVGYAILGLGGLGLLLVLERLVVLGLTGRRVGRQVKRETPHPGNPLGRILLAVEDWRHLPPEALQHKLDEAVLRELPKVRRGLPLLAVLAGVAPLLGLLGTVAGMIETFQAITLFGTGDPKLMSGGISEALVTTELGLVVAIPLVLCHGFLAGRSGRLVQVLDQQSAALVARRVEHV